VSFAAITLCVAFQRIFIVVNVYFLIDSVRKLLDTPTYVNKGRGGCAILTLKSLSQLCHTSGFFGFRVVLRQSSGVLRILRKHHSSVNTHCTGLSFTKLSDSETEPVSVLGVPE